MELFGHDMSRAAPYRKAQRGLGRTYQITNLFQELSVEENLTIAVQSTLKRRHRFWWPVQMQGDLDDQITVVLDQVIHDTALAALPLSPLCRPDCAGPDPDRYRPGLGERPVDPDEPAEAALDPRWAALQDLELD